MIKDTERQTILEQMGLDFLRFHDEEVRKDILSVIAAIKNQILLIEQQMVEAMS